MTRADAMSLLQQMENAEIIISECNHCGRSSSTHIYVEVAGRRIVARVADVRQMAQWALEDARRDLKAGGYTAP